jgi:nucleotide-binding universal stress UspA family protein
MAAIPQVVRISLKNILFTTDFSPAAKRAMPFALRLARIFGSALELVCVIPPEPREQVVFDRVPAQDDLVWGDARRKLESFARESVRDVPCRTMIRSGDLADVIPAMIRDHDIDLVIVGTHGRRGVSKMMLGSGAEKIYRSAQCPVLTVGPKARAEDWKLSRILCAVDLAHDAEPVLQYALSLAEENEAALLVMHTIPIVPWQHRPEVEAKTVRQLQSLIPEEAKNWCTPQYMVRWEHPAEAVLRAAEDRQSDLIVMGVHQSRAAGFSSHLPWPIASEVVSLAPCPVLTVRV